MINKNYQRILGRTLDEIGGASTYTESVRSIFDVLRTAPDFYKNALSSNEPDGLRQYIYRQSYDNHKRLLEGFGVDMETPVNKLLLTGFLTGTIRIMCVWADEGMQQDNAEILDCLYELMPDAFRKCFFVHYV